MKIQSGADENGISKQSRIPVRYADMSRMVGHIINNNNQNTILPSPMMTVWIQSMELAPERRNDPSFVGKVHHTERAWDRDSEQYGEDSGLKYTVERYMPTPYNMTLQLDIWTTNTTTKLQILEQIMSIFNPSIQLQQNSNQIDWSSIFEVELTDVQFSNRTIPQGTESERDVASLTFKVPIWINPPAKVKTQRLIHQIVTNVFDANIDEVDLDQLDPLNCDYTELDQFIITPGYHRTSIGVDSAPNELLLLDQGGLIDPTLSWKDLLAKYGEVQNGISEITLKLDPDIESDDGDIIGRIFLDDTRPNILTWDVDIDTLPINTLDPVEDLINPREVSPGNGLPLPVIGQRYMLLGDETIGNDEPVANLNTPWFVIAYENDIIEYTQSGWAVVFDSQSATNTEYVTATSNMQQYKFEESEWRFTYLGEYMPGYWRIKIN